MRGETALDPPKTMEALGLPDSVRWLARAAQAALEGAALDQRIDRELAAFAIQRHRIGPLLQIAVASGRGQADEDAESILLSAWQNNLRRFALQKISLQRISAAMVPAGISFAFFKGIGLAKQLYPAPEWRHVGDIDVLIEPHAWSRTIEALQSARFAITDPLMTLPPALQRVALHVIRDIGFVDIATGQRIEVHSRLLFSAYASARLLRADPSLGPHGGPNDQPRRDSPCVGPGVLCYLLMHGAVSGWSRLKWLVDIHAVLRRLERHERAKMVSIAEDCGVTLAMRAGLMVARDVFPDIALEELQYWVDDGTGFARARRRANRYALWLGAASDASPNPLHDRRAALASALMLHDDWPSQLATLSHGGLSASLRILGGTMSRKQAAASPGEQSR